VDYCSLNSPHVRKLDCWFTLGPNIKYYRAINWKMLGDKLRFESIIRPEGHETKEYILKRKK